MTDSLAIYDADGNLRMIVHDHADPHGNAWAHDGNIVVRMTRQDIDALLPAVNIDGVAAYLDLSRAVLAKVEQSDAAFAGKLSAQIEIIERKIAARAALEATPPIDTPLVESIR